MSAPLNVRVSDGSMFSHGDHDFQTRKSSICSATCSMGAAMRVERSMRNVGGRVAAKASTATMASAMTSRTVSMGGLLSSGWTDCSSPSTKVKVT